MLHDYLTLIWVFFKIGLFSFGGGLAMVPLFIIEFEKQGWMNSHEFLNVLSLAQVTPGAIAMNSATYVGNKVQGVGGGIIATLSLASPSIIVMLVLSKVLARVKNHPIKEAIFNGLKPVTVALILYAGFQIAETTFFKGEGFSIEWKPIVICLAIAVIQHFYTKLNPIFLIILSAIVGMILL
ncbi:chromate transporter [Fulvivirga maritima]|uniref:chromate transporter n=1 Tax=Fulvivirga maritima TaxID=2904247 RepID=UPI001F3E6248|nr:chromate transporter [Fulvivirga maritima]UII26013.1 chromate transporter [Fulvivirga maritima]